MKTRIQHLKVNARELRQRSTAAEGKLWSLLRNRNLGGYKFRRQHVEGPFILDFFCHTAKLAIELDGGGHAEPVTRDRDENRTRFLNERGIEVLRFWNHDALSRLDLVAEEILRVLDSRSSESSS